MISVKQLRKNYDAKNKGLYAIDGIDFTVPENHIYTLLGPSGCGKSTTLRSVSGLERPQEGEIAIGENVVFSSFKKTFIPPNERNISMVFQSYAVWPHMTVYENVAYPLVMKKTPRKLIKDRVLNALALVGLESYENRHPQNLSGGQQQRVALARAVVSEPRALLLDEPLSNLDSKLRVQMRTELKRLQTQLGITVLFVTHDQEESLSISDTVAVMNKGRIIQTGSPNQIYNEPNSRFIAEFIGRTNIIEGTMMGPTYDNLHVVETPIGNVRARLAVDEKAAGNHVFLSIRPESFKIAALPSDGDQMNVFPGTVSNISFMGDRVDYTVRMEQDYIFHTQMNPTEEGYRVGQNVFLHVSPKHTVMLLR